MSELSALQYGICAAEKIATLLILMRVGHRIELRV